MRAIPSTGAMLLSGQQKHHLEVGLSLPNPICAQSHRYWKLTTSFWSQLKLHDHFEAHFVATF